MLKRLLEEKRTKGKGSNLQIVVVPAIGLARPSEWVHPSNSSRSWLQKLIEDVVPEADIWGYEYSASQQGALSQAMLGEGHKLLVCLHDHCAKAEHRKQPLVLIAHGSGGFVVKKAIRLSSVQTVSEPFIDVVFGAVFLGSPHLTTDVLPTLVKSTLDSLLKCQNKGQARISCNENDMREVIEICQSFERVNPRFRIISVFESKETSTQRTIFSIRRSKSSNSIIGSQSLCTLGLEQREKVMDGESDHFDICKIRVGGPVYTEVAEFMRTVVQTAPRMIQDRFSQYKAPDGLDDDTLCSQSTADLTEMTSLVQLMELDSQTNSLPLSSPFGATGGSTTGDFEVIPSLDPIDMTSRDPSLPCFCLGTRQRMDSFFGREGILKEIDDYLLPPPDTWSDPGVEEDPEQLRSFAICGMGGMGKTELAVEYAFSRRKHFEAIFWLSADNASILAAEFAQIAQHLGLEDDGKDIAASCGVVHGWLTNPMRKNADPDTPKNKANWLIIFDNVDNTDVLPDYWPKTGRGSVLVTSRDPWARHNELLENGRDLPPLSIQESEAMMQRLTHVKATEDAQRFALLDITKKLGGLPLAIDQMSSVFRQLKLSYKLFLKHYNEKGLAILQETDSQKIRSLATLWALDLLSPPTAALLQVICLLDPDNISEELLMSTDSVDLELEHYPRTFKDYIIARKELLSSSLIGVNEEQEKITLHRLIQETVRGLMNEAQLFKAFKTALYLLMSVWPFQSMVEHHSIARFPKCEALFPSLLRLKDSIEPLIQSHNLSLGVSVAHLLNDAGWYLFERGLIVELKPFCELGLVVGQNLNAQVDEKVAQAVRDSHSWLGIATAETNEHELSMAHKRKWLDMLLQRENMRFPGAPLEDYELGYAYNEIGVAYANLHLLDEAAEAFQRSIKIFQGLDEYEDTMLGWPEPNLGFIYWLQGNLEDAEDVLMEILDIHAAAWGVDDTKSFKTGKILYALGNVLEEQGRLRESQNFHTRCLEQFKVTLGMNHHRMGDICHRMARHFMRQGSLNEADEYLKKALEIFASRPYLVNELARTTFLHGKLLGLMGQEKEAKNTLMKAWRQRRRILPADIRKWSELEEKDFDLIVAFWSR